MQFNRLHKVVSARACEYLFVLRQCYFLIKTEFIANAFPKKNFFSNIEQELNQKISQSAYQQTTGNLNNQMEMFGLYTPSLDYQRARTIQEGIIASQNAKDLYEILCRFEFEMLESEFISRLVE